MPYFEITGVGFDASSVDHTDKLVELLRDLLECLDRQLGSLNNDTVKAVLKADLFLATHFPKD